MSENIGQEISVCKVGLSLDRYIILNYLSSPSSSSPVSLPTETTNKQIKNFPFLQKTNSIIHSKQSRYSMVGSQIEIKQWKFFSMDTPSVDNKIGCIKGRLGDMLSALKDRKTYVRRVEKTWYQCAATNDSKICDSSLHSKQETLEQYPYSNGKYGHSFLFSKDGGMSNQDLVGLSKQIWNDFIPKQIIFTARHLPGILNKEADFESRTRADGCRTWKSCKSFAQT